MKEFQLILLCQADKLSYRVGDSLFNFSVPSFIHRIISIILRFRIENLNDMQMPKTAIMFIMINIVHYPPDNGAIIFNFDLN